MNRFSELQREIDSISSQAYEFYDRLWQENCDFASNQEREEIISKELQYKLFLKEFKELSRELSNWENLQMKIAEVKNAALKYVLAEPSFILRDLSEQKIFFFGIKNTPKRGVIYSNPREIPAFTGYKK